MYQATTNGIEISVEPAFVPERSNPDAGYFFFAYTVKIQNTSKRPAQVLARHWIIRDGRGRIEHVRGEGVVGHKPYLKPGESFEYTSFCPLATPTGNMRGRYTMIDDAGEKFEVDIPLFFLRESTVFH